MKNKNNLKKLRLGGSATRYKITMIYISFKNLLTKNNLRNVKIIFVDVIGCSIGIYKFMLFKSNQREFLISRVIFTNKFHRKLEQSKNILS